MRGKKNILEYNNFIIVMTRLFQGFAEHLFKLFDTDNSYSVSLQELVGGMGRLTT